LQFNHGKSGAASTKNRLVGSGHLIDFQPQHLDLEVISVEF